MTLRFYNCTDDYRVVNKNIGDPIWEETIMNPPESIDLITPTFIVGANTQMPLIYNYAECVELGRFYFITGQKSIKANKKAIECLVDVRKSFVNLQILATVIKNEFMRNSNIPDDEFPVDPQLHTFKVIDLDGSVFADSYRVIRTANNGMSY